MQNATEVDLQRKQFKKKFSTTNSIFNFNFAFADLQKQNKKNCCLQNIASTI